MSTNTILASAPLTSTGYHLKANGTTLGNSLIWDNGTNVGIGNTNTSYTLDVSGSGSMINIIGASSGDIATGFRIGRGASLGAEIYDNPADNITTFNTTGGLNLRVGGSNRLTIASTGAATFSSSLEAGKSGSLTVGDLFVDNPNKTVYVGRQSATGGDNSIFIVRNRLNSPYFYIDPSNDLAYFNNCKVGIGTASPITPLSLVLSTTNSQISTGCLEIQSYALNNSWVGDNIYFNGSAFKARNTGYVSQMYFNTDGAIDFYTYDGTITAGATVVPSQRMRITRDGHLKLISTSAGGTNLDMYLLENDGLFINSNEGATGRNIYFQTGGSEVMRMNGATRNVLLGSTTEENSRLVVTGADSGATNYGIRVFNSGANLVLGTRNDGLWVSGTLTLSPYNYSVTGRAMYVNSGGVIGYNSSTRESKANIKSIENVDFINQLNPVQFNYRKKNSETNEYTDELYDNTTYGFIADEIEKVNKELVFYNEDGTLAGVEYNSMIAILTKAIQELQSQINELKNK